MRVFGTLALAGTLSMGGVAAAGAERSESPEGLLLSEVPAGYSIDEFREPEAGGQQRLAWSPGLESVLFAARSGKDLVVAVNRRLIAADRIEQMGFTQDGRLPVVLLEHRGRATLYVGERRFGPFAVIERPAVSDDGSRVAFKARDGERWVAVVDGKEAGSYAWLGRPVLAPGSRVAYWARVEDRLLLLLDGQAAPGSPLTARTEGPEALPQVGQPVFSPDGKSLAFWKRLEDDRYLVVRDGKAGELFAAVGEPVFSPDGRSIAYGGAAGPGADLDVMVEGGKKTSFLDPRPRPGAPAPGPQAIRNLWGARYMADGRLAWFARLANGRTCFVLGGQASSEFDSVALSAVDATGRRIAFIAQEGERFAAVVDGQMGPLYDTVTFLQFDPTGGRAVYTATRGSATFVVEDGKEGERFDQVGWVRFSADGGTLAYWARRGDSWFVVADGARNPVGVAAGMIGNLVLGGADGRTPIFSSKEGRWYLHLGLGRREGPFDAISHFVWDPVKGAVHCGVRLGGRFWRRSFKLR